MKNNIPVFQYHPDPFATGVFRELEKPSVCPCCGEETAIIYKGPFYCVEEVKNLCPRCIASGAAAQKFDGAFQDECSVDEVSNPDKLEELIYRTPGYCGWQQEYWPAHCDDYCAFVGYVGYQELEQMGLLDEVLDGLNGWVRENIRALTNGGSFQGYLFQCLHCGKHVLCVDCD